MWDLEFRVESFRVWGLRVQGFRAKDQGLGFWGSGLIGFKALGLRVLGFRVRGLRHKSCTFLKTLNPQALKYKATHTKSCRQALHNAKHPPKART